MSITITSSDKEQLALIKRMREYMQDRTPEQLNRMPKDKNGFIDFHLIFKRVDEVKEGMKEFKSKIEAYNLGDKSVQDFMDKVMPKGLIVFPEFVEDGCGNDTFENMIEDPMDAWD